MARARLVRYSPQPHRFLVAARERRRRRRKAHNKLLKSRRMKNQWRGGHGPDRPWDTGYVHAGGKAAGWKLGGGLVNGILLGHPFTRTQRKLEDLIWRAVWMPFAPAMPPIEPLLIYPRIYTGSQIYTHVLVAHIRPPPPLVYARDRIRARVSRRCARVGVGSYIS